MNKNTEELLARHLFYFSEGNSFTVSDAVRGIQVFGSIGSGKSSGSGEFIAKKYLQQGWGGLVLCAKPDEATAWRNYIIASGRPESDIIHFCEDSAYQFNPLKYETERKTRGGGITFNLTELFMSIYKMGQRVTGSDSEEHERFWENSLKRLINRVIDLIKISEVEISIKNMIAIVSSIPQNNEHVREITELMNYEELEDPTAKAAKKKELKKFMESNLCCKCLQAASDNLDKYKLSAKRIEDFNIAYGFFFKDFPALDEKTQSTIKEMFLGFAEPFSSGILKNHFSSGINIQPEDSFTGKIILLDFPVMQYLVSGIYAQCLFKYLWQQSIQRREIDENTKPSFLWIDESQFFLNEYDTMFQTTARSSMACCVLLTQNMSNYYMQMGGKNVNAKVDSLLGNLGTLIFHNNSDAVTNEWASRLIGTSKQNTKNVSVAGKNMSADRQITEALNEHFLPQIQPMEFTMLRNGRKVNDYQVDAIIFSTSRTWNNNTNYLKTYFTQNH